VVVDNGGVREVEAGFVEISAMLRQGVYLLVHHDVVVYVGKGKVMLGRLYMHRVAWGKKSRKAITSVIPPKGMLFDRVFVQPCRNDEIDELEQSLIKKYQPRYNIQHKTTIPADMTGLVARIVASRGAAPSPAPRIDRRGF
jgi:hypothetical protein